MVARLCCCHSSLPGLNPPPVFLQAIQHCRGSPPTDWPQEAYVLIGEWKAGAPVLCCAYQACIASCSAHAPPR